MSAAAQQVPKTGKEAFLRQIGAVRVSGTEQLEGGIADLNNTFRFSHIKEIHIHPESASHFTARTLEHAACTPQILLDECADQVTKLRILDAFFLNLQMEDAAWNFSVMKFEGGTVVRVVVGDAAVVGVARTHRLIEDTNAGVVPFPKERSRER